MKLWSKFSFFKKYCTACRAAQLKKKIALYAHAVNRAKFLPSTSINVH